LLCRLFTCSILSQLLIEQLHCYVIFERYVILKTLSLYICFQLFQNCYVKSIFNK
jgi:hypothetical protein